MKKPSFASALVLIAEVINLGLAAFFVVLAVSPPVIFREPPRALPYLMLALYPCINVITLKYLGKGRGIVKAIWILIFSVNLLIIPGVIGFSVVLGMDNLFTAMVAVPLCLTGLGFYGQIRVNARKPDGSSGRTAI